MKEARCLQQGRFGCTEPEPGIPWGSRGSFSVTVSIPKPGNISLSTKNTTGSYTISWGAATGSPSKYQLQQRKDNGGWITVYDGSALSKSVSAQSTGIYRYRVRACYTICSYYTAEKTLTVVRTPGSISVPGTSTNGSIAVSWNSVSGAASYVVQEQKNSGSWSQVYGGAQLDTTLTGRGNGIYRYRVAALENGQTGSYRYSSYVTVSRAPAMPGGFSVPATTTSGSYTVSWNSVSGAQQYFLEETGTGSGSWTLTGTSKSFSKPLNGSYSYRVRACSAYQGVNACSAYTAKKTVQVSQPLLKVQSVSGQGAVTLLFNTGLKGAISCELKRNGTLIHQAAVNDGATFVDAVSSSGSYNYYYNCYDCLQGSFPDKCTEPNPIGSTSTSVDIVLVPSKPSLSVVGNTHSTDGSAAFTSASADPIQKVRWQKRVSSSAWPADTSFTEYVTTDGNFQVTGLTDGNWEIRSKNCNSAGCSDNWSNGAIVSVLHSPQASFSISFTGDFDEGSYSVNWSPASGTVDHYSLRESKNGFWGEWLDRGTSQNYKPDPQPDGNYEYEVKACNSSGCSNSVRSEKLTIEHPAPAAPSNLVATRVNQEIQLAWDKVTGGFDDEYEFRLNGEGWRSANTSLTATQPIGSYGPYTFDVRACNHTPGDRKCSSFTTTTYTVPDPDPTAPGWAKPIGSLALLDAGYSPVQLSTHQETLGVIKGAGGSSGGAASYQLPIELPPGRAGMQPEISLSYSSRAGNGVLGKGWSLAAGSQITRCPQTFAQDGQAIPVLYANTDRLCLDGQRLAVISGSYGASGAVYQTEQDTQARVTQYGGINGGSTWFKVELKNGRIRRYGDNADSRHIAQGVNTIKSWGISFEQDRAAPNSNSINYVYKNFGRGEYHLSDIYYTGAAQQNGDRRVSFEYGNDVRPDIESGYLAGGLTRLSKRLSEIAVYSQGEKVREYRFDYKLSGATKSSLLNVVTLCSGSGVCFAPTTFKWADAEASKQAEILGSATYSGANHLNSGRTIGALFPEAKSIDRLAPRGDFNGDGVRDWPGYFIGAEGQLAGTFNANTEGCTPYPGSLRCVELDANSDGKSDTWRIASGKLQIGISNGDGSFSWVSTPIALPGLDHILDARDYNGDGWVDLQIRRGDSLSNNELYLYLHTGNAQSPYKDNGQYVTTFLYDKNKWSHRNSVEFVGDITGNGLPDILVYNTTMHLGGVGDVGSPQLIPSKYLFTTRTSNGVSFVSSLVGVPVYESTALYFYYLLDINGDGLQDWVNWRGDESGLYYRLNKGGTFTDWEFASIGNSLPTRRYFYNKKLDGDRSYEVLSGLKYVNAFKKFDRGSNGKIGFIYPSRRLVESCYKAYDGGSLTEFCGDELYGKFNSSTPGNPIFENFDVSKVDNSLYAFEGLQFVEQADGSYKIEQYDPQILGTAYNSAVIDAFGNGLQDFVYSYGCVNYPDSCSVPNAQGHSEGVYIQRNRGSAQANELYEPTDMLVAVENGFGARDEWHYRPLSSRDDRYHSSAKPFYERGGYLDSLSSSVQDDHFEFTSSMYVVAEHRQSNGVGGLNKKQYRYKGAVFNNKGRGFQGFHTIIEEDLAADIETQSDFHQIFPLAGKLHKQRKWELGDRSSDTSGVNAFEESSFHWQFWAKGGHSSPKVVDALTDSWSVSANDPYFVGPKKQSSIHRTLNRSGNSRTHLYTQSQTTSFDAWGNVLLAENRYEEANSSHIVVSTTDTQYAAGDEANWWINKPSKQTVTKKSIQSRKGVAIAANTDTQQSVVVDFLQWDSNARKPKQVKTTPSNGKWTQVDTVYNNYSLPTKITTSAEGETKTRVVETTAFSADGYFPKTVKNAQGHTVTTETNAKFGQPDSVTDANGLTTRYSYDTFGRAVKVTAPSALGLKAAPDGHTALQWCNSGCSRAPVAVFKTIQQQAGTPEQITYHDQLGRVIRTEVQAFDGSDWIARTVTYNALGQTTFESVPHYASSGTSYGTRYLDYDTFGRALRKTVNQTNGQQLDVTYTHEQASGFTTDILVNGRTMSRTYNGLQQLTETVDALSGTTRYAYDGAGNPIVLQDANSNRITAKYNALGQKEWVDDPNMGSKSFTYTGFGEVETEIDGNLDVTSFTYDRLGRMESRSVNGTEEASWKYDSAANGKGLLARESRSDASYTRNYSYDGLSRPYKVTTAIDGEDFITVNHYDSNFGRLKGLSYPSGLTLKYGYNSSGYQFRISNAASGYTYREITQMDAWGEWEFANIAAGNYTIGRSFYSETGQMAGTTFDSLVQNHQGIAYSYDSFGNLTEQVVQLPSKTPALNVENHTYDALNRLDYSSRTDGPSIDYDYDAIGNLLKKDDFASSYSYTGGSSGGPSAVKSVSLINGGTKTYGYDQNGNRTHENGAQQIWYNAFNKPTRINRNGANLYFYYGADQMRYKQVNQTSGKTTLYIDKLFEKITGGGETQYRHFIGDIAVLTTTDNGSDISHKIGFSHRDRLGSAAAVGDEAGNLKESHSFDPFGKPRQGNILDKDTAILESEYSTRGFTDHEHLDDVELIHMNGRAYDYNLGRFLSVDPIIVQPGDSQALNPYSYILNNPLAGTDPSGYAPGDRAYGAGIGIAKSLGIISPENAELVIAAELACQACNGAVVEAGASSTEAIVESGKTFIREVAAGVGVTTAAAVAAEKAIQKRLESGKKGRKGGGRSQSSNGNGNGSVSDKGSSQQASDIGSQSSRTKNTVWHGTDSESAKSIKEEGLRVDRNRSADSLNDEAGFSVTTNKQDAIEFAEGKTAMRNMEQGRTDLEPVVLKAERSNLPELTSRLNPRPGERFDNDQEHRVKQEDFDKVGPGVFEDERLR
ncbi:RHS repeat-associated core domain-containing protein [Microbulbifer sp. CnH-101-F]|uniref:RHS repeat-associated core domain-containing protein n=1 Tax=Microbulbifer sp. CnH-101-F TaxID=3243392 RepID=UPI0040391BBE